MNFIKSIQKKVIQITTKSNHDMSHTVSILADMPQQLKLLKSDSRDEMTKNTNP